MVRERRFAVPFFYFVIFVSMKRFPFIFLLVFSTFQFSCSKSPSAGDFAPPQLGDVRVVSGTCHSLEFQSLIRFYQAEENYLQQMEYGFYLLPDSTSAVPLKIPASREGNMLSAKIDGLSSGVEYLCTPFVSAGGYEARGIETRVATVDPFKDKAFKEVVLANFDKDKDGGISRQEALQVTKMEVITAEITDLAGVELFLNLQELICRGPYNEEFSREMDGTLVNLDISANVNLVYLHCGYNKLQKLDVSNNTKLHTLHCHNTMIDSLDLGNNPSIVILEARDCPYLVDVKFPVGSGLRSVNLHACDLASVDLSELALLDSFSAGWNYRLREFDFSNNPLLYYLVLSGLPEPKEFDLRHNDRLGLFYGEECAALERVYLSKKAKLEEMKVGPNVTVVYE